VHLRSTKEKGGSKTRPSPFRVCVRLEAHLNRSRITTSENVICGREGVAAVERRRTDRRTRQRGPLIQQVLNRQGQGQIVGDLQARRQIEIVVGWDLTKIDRTVEPPSFGVPGVR
jgi:hypothetical protein